MLRESGKEAKTCHLGEHGKILFSKSSYDIAKVSKIFIPDCPLLGVIQISSIPALLNTPIILESVPETYLLFLD